MTERKPISSQLRFSVLSRDRFTCRYCSRSAPEVVLEIDHVKPVSKGGTNDLGNLVAACSDCNGGKSANEVDFVPAPAKARTRAPLHPLVGTAFLSFIDGRCCEQGLITAIVDDGGASFAICQFFEWMMGEPSYQRLIPVAELVFPDKGQPDIKTYRLFATNEERNSYYEWRTHKGAQFEPSAR